MKKTKATFLRLPYKAKGIYMLIALPDKGVQVKEVLALMCTKQTIDKLKKIPITGEVDLKMPRFKLTSTHSLASKLTELGISSVFSEGADLSGISDAESLTLADVVQKAVVEIEEQGNRVETSLPDMPASKNPLEFTLDRPFIFLILNQDPRTLLFAGVVENPNE